MICVTAGEVLLENVWIANFPSSETEYMLVPLYLSSVRIIVRIIPNNNYSVCVIEAHVGRGKKREGHIREEGGHIREKEEEEGRGRKREEKGRNRKEEEGRGKKREEEGRCSIRCNPFPPIQAIPPLKMICTRSVSYLQE